jgi:uncharacterized membrane protein
MSKIRVALIAGWRCNRGSARAVFAAVHEHLPAAPTIAIGRGLSYKSDEHPCRRQNVRHRTTALGLTILLATVCTGAQRAHAGLRFCNQGNFKFVVAVGYIDREKGWVAKGWHGIEGGECKDAIRAPLDNRYYYFHAAGRGPDQTLVKYNGETPFCVQSKKFELYQAQYGKSSQEECSKDGLRSEKFMKLDVKGSPDYTVNLGSPAAGAAPAEAPARPPSVATGGPVQPPANQPPPTSSAAPGSGASSTACKRYPNLC